MRNTTMPDKRSPLKGRPLRNPGQSLDEQIGDIIYDYIVWPVLFAVFMVILAGLEWIRYLRPITPSPAIYTFGAAAGATFAVYRVWKALPHLHALKLGRDGEKVVGQFLETLRERGYRVFHDISGGNFNLDHVLIGPAGVFTIETKTYRKPSGDARVTFNGDSIRIGGFEPDRAPVVQARAQASWLRELLAESTGREFEVRSAIVFPGWFVDDSGPRERTVWVLNPKALPTFLDYEPTRLSQESIHLASFHLSRFVRTAVQ
jgi:Nuclease-related domain